MSYIFSAQHGLDIAQTLSKSNETSAAIKVLEEAVRLFEDDDRLVKELARLYLLQDDMAGVDRCLEIIDGHGSVSLAVAGDASFSKDLSYLKLREKELEEDEFDFMLDEGVSHSSPSVSDRKTITLKRDRTENAGPKIVWRNRLAPSCSSVDDDVTSDFDELPDTVEEALAGSANAAPLIPEPIVGLLTSRPTEEALTSSSIGIDELAQEVVPDPLSSLSGDTWSSSRESVGTYSSSAASLDDEDDEDDERGELLELDLFNFWDDDLDDSDNEGEDDDASFIDVSLGATIDRAERARQVAIDTVAKLGWELSKLGLVEDVFFTLGWGSARRAFEDAVAGGACYEEMFLAFHIKKMWMGNPRYWLSFYRFWMDGEETFGACKTCSWPSALSLVRTFSYLPAFEDIALIIEREFDRWYESNLLRHKFPSFHHYIFGARLRSDDPYQSLMPDTESFDYQGFTNPCGDQYEWDDGLDVNAPDILFRVNFLLDDH
jgi:hypothetical protein